VGLRKNLGECLRQGHTSSDSGDCLCGTMQTEGEGVGL